MPLPIKVLYISHTSEMHGSGRALLHIMQQMRQRGVTIKVVLPVSKGDLHQAVIEHNIPYIVFTLTASLWPKFKSLRDFVLMPYRILQLLYGLNRTKWNLRNLVKQFKPDIIHTNVGVIHASYRVAKQYNVPHVWHIREYQDLDFGWKPFPTKGMFVKFLLDYNNYPVAITKGVFEHHHLEFNTNAQIVYDGVFEIKNRDIQILPKHKYLLFVGLVSEGKGARDVLEAFIAAAADVMDYQLWFAGGGNNQYLEMLKQQATLAGLAVRVKFLGHRNDVFQLMSHATALIVGSRFEGFGFITAEAMYHGCLVIGRNSAGTKEQFDNGYAMFGEEIGLRYHNIAELVKHIESVCNHDFELFRPMITNAYNTVTRLYSAQKNAETLYALYQKIVLKNEK